VIKLRALGTKTRLDIAQTVPIGQLREGHAQELIQARERFHLPLALISGHASAKRGQWKVLHQLREHELALVHQSSPRIGSLQGRRTRARSSN